MRGASRPGGKPVLCARTRLVLAGAVGAGAVVVKFDHPGEFNQTDPAVTVAIQQGAASPGSANVIGSGQKLAPNRPLNEVLNRPYGFGGPVLVAQGKNDRVSGPTRAQERAQLFKRLRPGVTVRELDAGHCPHDEVPEQVAQAILEWLPDAAGWKP